MLPKGWTRANVREACAIKNNLRLPLSTDERVTIPGPYPYFGPTGVLGYIDQYRINEEFALIGEDGDHFLKFRDRPMTLMFSGKANVNNHAHVIGNSAHCSARWFHYWFMHRDLTAVLSRQGVGRYKLTKAGLEKLEIWLPAKEEQSRISQLLSAWDEAIFATERLLGNRQKLKQALMQSLLSAKHRERIGRTPLKREPASNIFEPNSVRRNGNLELLSVMQDVGVVPRSSMERKVVMPDGSTDGYKLVEPGNFVISLRSFEGGLEYSRFTGLVSPAYTVLRPTQPIVDDFYRHYFKSKDFIGRLAVAVIGIRDGKQVNYGDFSFLKLPHPSFAEQQSIATVLNSAEAAVTLQATELARLRKEKSSLLQQLLTGKRRVRLHESAEATSA